MFQLPNVVLDLDAEDNPHGRQYDDVDEEIEVAKWARNEKVDAIAERLEVFSEEMVETEAFMKSTASTVNP